MLELTLKGQSTEEFGAIHEHYRMISSLKLLLLVSHHQVCKLDLHLEQEKEQAQTQSCPFFSSSLQNSRRI